MRFVDTNVFINYLVDQDTEAGHMRSVECHALIERVRTGEEDIATSEAVVAEVIYVLTSRRLFGVHRSEVVANLKPILAMPGVKLANKGVCLDALDYFASHGFLDFTDALLTAYVERSDPAELYSYDADFDRMSGVTRLVPSLPNPPVD